MSVWCAQMNTNQLLVSAMLALQDLHVRFAELQQKLSAPPPAADTHTEQVFLLICLLLFLLSFP